MPLRFFQKGLTILLKKQTNILSAAFVLMGTAILSQILGLVRQRLLVGNFGASDTLGAYLASSKLPDFRHNTKGSAKGHIFHGHAKNSAGTIYVLEWTVLCAEKQIIALIGFGTHENYRYRQNPLNATEVEKILGCTESKQIIERVANKIDQAKAKVLRTNYNYRLNN